MYSEAVGAIIERDFFPHLAKMKNQLEWLQAVNSGDSQVGARHVQTRCQSRWPTQGRPATFLACRWLSAQHRRSPAWGNACTAACWRMRAYSLAGLDPHSLCVGVGVACRGYVRLRSTSRTAAQASRRPTHHSMRRWLHSGCRLARPACWGAARRLRLCMAAGQASHLQLLVAGRWAGAQALRQA